MAEEGSSYDWPELRRPRVDDNPGGEIVVDSTAAATPNDGELAARTEMVPKRTEVNPEMRKQLGAIRSHLYKQGPKPVPVLKQHQVLSREEKETKRREALDEARRKRANANGQVVALPKISKSKNHGEGSNNGPLGSARSAPKPSTMLVPAPPRLAPAGSEGETPSASNFRPTDGNDAGPKNHNNSEGLRRRSVPSSKRAVAKQSKEDAKLKEMLESLAEQRSAINKVMAPKPIDAKLSDLRRQRREESKARDSRIKDRQEAQKKRKAEREMADREQRKAALTALLAPLEENRSTVSGHPPAHLRKSGEPKRSRSNSQLNNGRKPLPPLGGDQPPAAATGSNNVVAVNSAQARLYASPNKSKLYSSAGDPQNNSARRTRAGISPPRKGATLSTNKTTITPLRSSSEKLNGSSLHHNSSSTKRRQQQRVVPLTSGDSNADTEYALTLLKRAEELDERSRRSRELAQAEALNAKKQAYSLLIHQQQNSSPHSGRGGGGRDASSATTFVTAELSTLQSFCAAWLASQIVMARRFRRSSLFRPDHRVSPAYDKTPTKELEEEQDGDVSQMPASTIRKSAAPGSSLRLGDEIQRISHSDEIKRTEEAKLFVIDVIESAILGRERARRKSDQSGEGSNYETDPEEQQAQSDHHQDQQTSIPNTVLDVEGEDLLPGGGQHAKCDSRQEEEEAESSSKNTTFFKSQNAITPTPPPNPMPQQGRRTPSVATPSAPTMTEFDDRGQEEEEETTIQWKELQSAPESAAAVAASHSASSQQQQDMDNQVEEAEQEEEEELLPHEELLQEAREGGPKEVDFEPHATQEELQQDPMRGTLPIAGPEHVLDYAAGGGAGPKEFEEDDGDEEDVEDEEDEDDVELAYGAAGDQEEGTEVDDDGVHAPTHSVPVVYANSNTTKDADPAVRDNTIVEDEGGDDVVIEDPHQDDDEEGEEDEEEEEEEGNEDDGQALKQQQEEEAECEEEEETLNRLRTAEDEAARASTTYDLDEEGSLNEIEGGDDSRSCPVPLAVDS